MLRAWRTHDFRSIFHLACKVGVTPEVIADSTGLPVDLVLNVMKGNTSLTGDSGAGESVASGLGMPQDVRGILGLAPARPRPVAAGPLAPKSKAGTSVNEQPITIKLRGDVGERIAELRYERGLTQEQLAERAGISAVMVSKLEQHARTPSLACSIRSRLRWVSSPGSCLSRRWLKGRLAGRSGGFRITCRLTFWAGRISSLPVRRVTSARFFRSRPKRDSCAVIWPAVVR